MIKKIQYQGKTIEFDTTMSRFFLEFGSATGPFQRLAKFSGESFHLAFSRFKNFKLEGKYKKRLILATGLDRVIVSREFN